jgi:serine/threonine-protein kinase
MASSEAANRLVGRAFAGSQQPEMAIQYYNAAIRLDPDSWRGHNDMGAVLFSLGRLESARQEFNRVIQLRPASAIGYENLGATLLAVGDFAGARHSFEVALERAPLPSAYFNLGVAAFFSREYAASITYFEDAIRTRPTSDVYIAGLADALRRLHRAERSREGYAHALDLLDELNKTRPLSVAEQCRRVIYLARLGDRVAATTALGQIVGGVKSRDLFYASAIVAMLEGRPRAANRNLKDAVSVGFPSMLIEMNPDFDDVPP